MLTSVFFRDSLYINVHGKVYSPILSMFPCNYNYYNIFIHAYKYIACKMCTVLNMVHIYI